MMIRSVIAAILVAMPVAAARAEPADKVDAVFASWSSMTPGCTVSATRDGRTIVERAYGSADLEHDIANTPSTIFEAGSVSKQFVAAAILMLAQDGKISLKDDIRKYFPELPDYGDVITVEHLVHHTSGLRDWGMIAIFAGWPRSTRAYTFDDMLDIMKRQRGLNHRPGDEWVYTNTGYNLLTLLVQRVAGASMADFTQARIFKPLGMTSTSWRDNFHRIVKKRAVAYERTPNGYQQLMPFEDVHGNGGLLTTVGDLQIWNEALAKQRLGAALSAEMLRRGVLNDGRQSSYAGGLLLEKYNGFDEIYHSGATAGYRAWLAAYPAQKLSVAVLCNAGDASPVIVGHKVADIFLPPQPMIKHAELEHATERAGVYVNQRTGGIRKLVAYEGGLRVENGPPLTPVSGDTLGVNNDELVFKGNDQFQLRSSKGNIIDYRKAVPFTPSEKELEAFTGAYRSDEVDATYKVVVENGKLVMRLEQRSNMVMPLAPAYQDTFEMPYGVVRFDRKGKGQARSFSFTMEDMRGLRFERVRSTR